MDVDPFEFVVPEPRVFQWKYAACKRNIENRPGFYTFSMSDCDSTEKRDELKEALVSNAAHYAAPEGSPPRPTEAELERDDLFPIAFSYFKLKTGETVLCRVRAIGKSYDKDDARYGNFFAHALALEKGESWPDLPIDYWKSPSFVDGLTSQEAALGKTPDPLPTLDLKDVKPSDYLRKKIDATPVEKMAPLRAYVVDRFLTALKSGKGLAVFGAFGKNGAFLTKTLCDSIPAAELTRNVYFSTYCTNPRNEIATFRALEQPSTFALFSPRSSSLQKELVSNEFLEPFDVAEIKNRAPLKTEFAKFLSTPGFLEFAKRFDYSSALESIQMKTAAFDALENAAQKSVLAKEILALYGKKLLDALENVVALYKIAKQKTFPDEKRLQNVWSFLEEQRYDLQARLLNELTQNDYASAENSVELLSFCVRCDKARKKENKTDQNDVGQMVVDFWLRQMETASEGGFWIEKLPEIIEKLFGKTRCDLAVSYLQEIARRRAKDNLPVSQRNVLSSRPVVRRASPSNAALSQLILGLGVHAAIYDYDYVDDSAKTVLKATYGSLPEGYDIGIRTVFFSILGKKAYHWMTHAVLVPIFCKTAADESNYFDSVVNFLGSRCVENWKQGRRWQTAAENADPFKDLSAQVDDEDASSQWEFVSDQDLLKKKGGGASDKKGSFSKKSLAPGAESALEYFLNEKKFKALFSVFEDFSASDIKRFKKCFEKTARFNNVSTFVFKLRSRNNQTQQSRRNPVLMVAITAIVLGLAVGTYFLLKYFNIF